MELEFWIGGGPIWNVGMSLSSACCFLCCGFWEQEETKFIYAIFEHVEAPVSDVVLQLVYLDDLIDRMSRPILLHLSLPLSFTSRCKERQKKVEEIRARLVLPG